MRKRKKQTDKKPKQTPYSTLATFIVEAPCYWCGADIYRKEKHREGCRMTKEETDETPRHP